MTRFIFALLSALFLLASPAAAAQDLGHAVQEGPSADIAPERWQAAEELLQVTEMAEMMQRVTDQQLQEQLADSPEMAPFRDVLREFFHKYLTWKTFKEPFTRIYAETFTLDELRELTAFYNTPTGRRVVQVQAEIMQKSNRLGKQVIEEHQGELIEAIQERASEVARESLKESQSQPSPPASHEHPPAQGGRIILVLYGAEVAEISAQQLTALDRKGERQVMVLTEDSSFQDETGFPVDDQLKDDQGQWDQEKLREFLPAGSKIQVQYFVRGEDKLIHLLEKSN